MEESRRRRSRRIEIHPAGGAQRVADHCGRSRCSRREILVVVREIVGRRCAATTARSRRRRRRRCRRVTGRCRRRQGRKGLVGLQAVVMVVMAGQLRALSRLLAPAGHRGRTAVMAVVMRLMLMGRMGEHGGRRVLMTVMVVVMVSGGDHGVTVNVLLAAPATDAVIALAVMRRRMSDRGAAGVETQQLLNGERRPLRQRVGRNARNAAGRGQQAAQQSWSGHVNVTIGVLK